MVVVDFRITTVGAALAAIVCGGGAVVVFQPLEARPVLEHASCVSAVGFTPSPSALVIPCKGASRQSLPPFHQIGFTGAGRSKSARPVVGLFLGKTHALMLLVFTVVTPVRLHQDGIDLFGVDHADLIPHRFDHASDAQVFDAAQHSLAAAGDEVHRRVAEGGVGESDPVELFVDELRDAGIGQGGQLGGVGHPAADVFVHPQLQGVVEGALSEEDEIVVAGEVFEQEPQFPQGVDGDEMGVINDGDDELAFVMELARGVDEAGFAFVIIAVGFQFEGFTEQAQHGVPGVEAAVDHGGDPFFLVCDGGWRFSKRFSRCRVHRAGRRGRPAGCGL